MIVPVKKARVFVLEEHKDELIRALQKASLLMIIPSSSSSADVTYENALMQRINKAINDLNRYGKKKSLFQYHEVTYEKFMLEDELQVTLLESVERDVEELNNLISIIKKTEELHQKYLPFREIDIRVSDLRKSSYTRYHVGHVKNENLENIQAFFKEKEIPYQTLSASEYGPALFFASYYEEDETLLSEVERRTFSEVELPEVDLSIGEYVANLEKDLAESKEKVTELQSNLKQLAKNKNQLELMYDRIQAKIDRKSITFGKTERSFYVDGWVRADQIDYLNQVVKSVTTEFDMELNEPTEADIPPTALKNNKFVTQFETITNMFAVPNHKEIDPNPAVAIWYWIIFGIMMGDIGYGLVMLTLFGLAIKLMKPKGTMKNLITVFFYSGITALIAGILFGSFFGAPFDLGALIGSIFSQQWTTVILNPVNDPLIMLGFSLVFGVFHIINGLGFKFALLIKRKDYLGAIADSLSWIFVLIGLLFVAAQMFLFNEIAILSYIGLAFAGIGALLLLFLAGRKSKNIFGKVLGGLGAIYKSTSYVSDILSYSRILALSLSTAVIASTMNLLAGMIQGSVVGFILSILVYIVGHVFNFVMGMLSAYVHDGRLQYIEFFNKFYEGGGYLFEPFTIRLKQINEISDLREERR
ncbi:MAG: V-type ATP synthase subunit I [Bacilli bacterium]|nr:V-type ATP synthase subunit I [Bacilli bacterium]